MASRNKATRAKTRGIAVHTSPGATISALTPQGARFRSLTRTVGNEKTHEGAPSTQSRFLTPEAKLRRSVLSCLLWEDTFYEDGQSIADRITSLAQECEPETVANLASEARGKFHLRHVPLLLLCALAKTGSGRPGLVKNAILSTVQRADEIAELTALYWSLNPKRGEAGSKNAPLPAQFKKGLAEAFYKFDAHALNKYDRDKPVKLRDVMFLSHAKPRDASEEALFKAVAERVTETADTWEVAISATKSKEDKKAQWERMLRDGKLGYMALLRNLRNMTEANVDRDLVKAAILARKGARRVLPFRYVAAARAAPTFEAEIDSALCEAISEGTALTGKTIVLVDVSSSMHHTMSAKSNLMRLDAAATLASVVYGDVRVFTFSNALVEIPPRRGMAGVDAVIRSQPHMSTYLGRAVTDINTMPHDRLIVITDEQSSDRVPAPVSKHAYMINVAPYQNGVGYGEWTKIDGFSEQVLRWIEAYERELGDEA